MTFTQWSMGMFPIVVVLFSFCYFLLTRFYPIKILTVIEADSVIDKQLRDCGRPLLEERFLGLLLVCTIAGWILLGEDDCNHGYDCDSVCRAAVHVSRGEMETDLRKTWNGV